jgi:ubiquinone/menaquinone biosynthesis C-methylase UbiE
MDLKINSEEEFHDNRFSHEIRQPTWKFYCINDRMMNLYREKIRNECRDKKLLELGCGKGNFASEIATYDACVTGIDISAVAIMKAKESSVEKNVQDHTTFIVMNAEKLEFDDNYFDKIYGTAILHHLNLTKTIPELARVIKKDATAIFIEPFGHNPLINLYRKMTPKYRTMDEHPLLMNDIKRFEAYFEIVKVQHFFLAALIAVPFRNFKIFLNIKKLFEKIDDFLFLIPFIRRFSWYVLITVSGSKI